MRIGKHGLRDHVRLLLPLFALITAVWALRLILAAANSPSWLTHITSVTTTTEGTLLLAVLLIHFRRFGGYASVVAVAVLINLWAEILIVAAIVFSALTATQNVYTAPEYSIPGDDPLHIRHIYAHLTYGLGIGILVSAGFGCLLLLLLRTLLTNQAERSSWRPKNK